MKSDYVYCYIDFYGPDDTERKTIDEAAFQPNLESSLRAAQPMLAGGRLSFAKTLSTVENGVTSHYKSGARCANRVSEGSPMTRQLKKQPVIQADIYIWTDFECAGFGASTMKLS
jgi:hypothetical protein